MANFKENISLFISEAMSSCMRQLKEVDDNYRDINSARVKASGKFEDLLKTLSSKDKEFLESYRDE